MFVGWLRVDFLAKVRNGELYRCIAPKNIACGYSLVQTQPHRVLNVQKGFHSQIISRHQPAMSKQNPFWYVHFSNFIENLTRSPFLKAADSSSTPVM